MRMIPSTPHRTHSQAEKRVFDLLRTAASPLADSFTAYHSLNLTGHAYKRFGEIDFLICGPSGMFVLEVKGGRIACEGGLWRCINRYGESTPSREGPFRQAESALHALRAVLRADLPEHLLSALHVGFAVIFPDCVWEAVSVEWDRRTLADARDLRQFEGWLETLVRYWQKKDPRPGPLGVHALKTLHARLRPAFETAIPLQVQIERVEARVAGLTRDQMTLLDVVDANPRVMCSGGAGTGKTFLAVELAKRWTADGSRVVLACHSPWLRRFLESRFQVPGLSVTLASGIETAARRMDVDMFDALIVDEGQDLMNRPSLAGLHRRLKGGLRYGRWCFFHDVNNQAGLFGPVDPDALDLLERCRPARVPLTKNCRNTRAILETVKGLLGADMGIHGVGEGPDVRQQVVGSGPASALAIEKEIAEIVQKGGVHPGGLTILSPMPAAQSSVSLIDERLRCQLVVLDAFALRSFPPERISFSEIAAFKGLENEAILVIDLPFPDRFQPPPAAHYVAMSRGRAMLSLVFRRDVRRDGRQKGRVLIY